MAITLAMACMVLAPVLLFGGLGVLIGRRRDKDGHRSNGRALGVGVAFAVVGALIGGVAIVGTFYESAFDPVLVLDVAPGATLPQEIFLIEDPAASQELAWSVTRTEVRAPVDATGVVRVRSLEGLIGQYFEVRLSNGETNTSFSSRPTPAGLPGRSLLCIGFAAWEPDRRDVCALEGAELVSEIASREAR